jgi:hypothetical protein
VFRDDEQLSRACRALLASVRHAELWTRSGPTPEAMALLERDGGPLSSGERIVLLAAFAFWNGSGRLELTQGTPSWPYQSQAKAIINSGSFRSP